MIVTRLFTKLILPGKLHTELTAAINGLFTGIEYAPETNQVTVKLNAEPSGTEDQTITDTVNNHTPSYLSYKIWDYVLDPPVGHTPPLDLDYKKGLTTRLHPKNIFVQGELQLREYYSGASVNPDGSITFTDLVLKEENVFTRDVGGFAIYKTQTISWVREDESIGPETKVTTKYYSGIDKIQEGQKRRGNLIDELMMEVAVFLITIATVVKGSALDASETETEIQKGRDLLSDYSDHFSDFVSHSSKDVITDITNDATHSFLDLDVPGSDPALKIRDYILTELNI